MKERIDSIITYYKDNSGPCGDIFTRTAGNNRSEASIYLFPNPASEQLTISTSEPLQNAQYGIYNLLGKIVLKGEIPMEGRIDLSSIPKGVFILEVKDGGNLYHQKFLKM